MTIEMQIKNGKGFFIPLLFFFIVTLFLSCKSSSSQPSQPMIAVHPSDVTITEPEAAVFRVSATSDSPLSYQWRRDKTDIPGETGNEYILDPTSVADDGARFSVVVNNPHGSVTSQAATLTVNHQPLPPTIVVHPSNMTVTEPEAAVFRVSATSDSPLSYQWRRYEMDIPGETGNEYNLDPTLVADDGARFSVMVTNPHGSVTSQAATLTVNPYIPQPPVIVVQPADVTVTEPEPAVFNVSASGDGPLSYQWFKNGIPLPDSITNHMRAYLTLDEETGFVFHDAYGDNHGHCAGEIDADCPLPAPGRVNGGQSFDGNTTGIDVPAGPAFNWANCDSFSIEFWVKAVPGQTCSTSDQVMVGRVDNNTGLRWTLGCAGGSGRARFQLADADGTTMTIESDKVITTGAWHHIVGVRDGVNDINALYVDGTDVVSVAQSYNGGFDSITAPLNIGYLDSGEYFEGVLDEVAVYDGVFSENEIRTRYFLSRGYLETCDMPVRIMPTGDSITYGKSSGISDVAKMTSYRKNLWDMLMMSRYNVNFVGNLMNGEFYQFSEGFDPYHEGHGGWTDQQVSYHVYDWLVENPAEIVLLHIGTNHRTNDKPRHVAQILDAINWYEDDYETSVTVILARIINRITNHSLTSAYNDNVVAMAQSRIDNDGDKIIIVDMEFGAGLNYSQEPDGDMWDNLHPFETGYAKMAGVWFDALDDILPDCRFFSINNTLKLPRTRRMNDDGARFSVLVTSPYGSVTSRSATLTVHADAMP